MSHFLPLVAKLAGTSRHALQEMICNGERDTFDGMIELNELLRAFPGVQWEDDALDNFNYFPHAQPTDVETTLSHIIGNYSDLHRFDVYMAGSTEQLQIARKLFLKQCLPELHWRARIY